MLDPDQRHLYVNALKPPPGFVLGEAIATTYSLDLSKLLSVPLALVMPQVEPRRLGEAGAIELLQALRRASDRLTVFCNRACIAAPYQTHVLYGLLESVVVQVGAPGAGSLHAKLWLVRFEPEDGEEGEPLMRLIVLSRNLTHDRTWDVSVTLEGELTGRRHAFNKPLVEFLRILPERAVGAAPEAVRERVERLSEQAWRTDWELPDGYDELAFHALGTSPQARSWTPVHSKRLVVISPFIRADALQALAETTDARVALISRPEELDALAPDTTRAFERVYVLDEAAESEDGEDTSLETTRRSPCGLHAKVYVAEQRSDTHLYLGSANATNGALLQGRNLEFMVELVGKTRNVRGIDALLSKQAFGAMLMPYTSPEEPLKVDAEAEAAERALSDAACKLAESGLQLAFEAQGADYLPVLSAAVAVALPRVAGMRAWLVTTDATNARDCMGLTQTGRAELALCTPASATGFVAFELAADYPGVSTTFTLNVPVVTMPPDREGHITRVVVNNRERLFKYLLTLLDVEAPLLNGLEPGERSFGAWSIVDGAGAGLLERLVRVRARDPQRLRDFQRVIDALLATPEGQEIVPKELLEVWEAVKLPEAQA